MRFVVVSLLLLCGCKCPEAPVVPPVAEATKERDAYIDRLENEASEGSAALGVALSNLQGSGVGLVSLTKDRLDGIKKPSKDTTRTPPATPEPPGKGEERLKVPVVVS